MALLKKLLFMIKCLLGLMLFAFFLPHKVNTPTSNLCYLFSLDLGAISTLRISIDATSLILVLLAFVWTGFLDSFFRPTSFCLERFLDQYVSVCMFITSSTLLTYPCPPSICDSAPSLSLNFREQKHMGQPFINSV